MDEEIENIINEDKDVHIQLLKESLWDVRDQRNFFKKLMVMLCVMVFILIIGVVCISVCTQKSLTSLALQQQTKEYVSGNSD